MVRPYEAVVVLNPALDAQEGEALNALLARLEKVITDSGGTLRKIDRWGRRRLAYPIQRQTEGYYVLLEFDGQPGAAQELERILRITDGVLRHLVVRQVVKADREQQQAEGETVTAVGEEGSQTDG